MDRMSRRITTHCTIIKCSTIVSSQNSKVGYKALTPGNGIRKQSALRIPWFLLGFCLTPTRPGFYCMSVAAFMTDDDLFIHIQIDVAIDS